MNKILEPIVDNLPRLLFVGLMFLSLAGVAILMLQSRKRLSAVTGSIVKVHGINYFVAGGDSMGSVRLLSSGGELVYVDISAVENLLKNKGEK